VEEGAKSAPFVFNISLQDTPLGSGTERLSSKKWPKEHRPPGFALHEFEEHSASQGTTLSSRYLSEDGRGKGVARLPSADGNDLFAAPQQSRALRLEVLIVASNGDGPNLASRRKSA